MPELVILTPAADPMSPAALRAQLLAVPTPSGHTLGALTAAWLGEQSDSKNTRAAYSRQITVYLDWCLSRDLDPVTGGLPEITMYGTHLADAVSTMTKRPYKANTRANMLAVVSSWYTYLVRASALTANSARDAKRGMRVSEGCGVDLDDFGYREGKGVLNVRMKGSKQRSRVIGPDLATRIDAYLAVRPVPAAADDDAERALLLTRAGRRVTRRQVYRLVERLAAVTGVPMQNRITPHSLRHTRNTIARVLGASIEDRRDALGHSSVAITQLYDHVAQEPDRDLSTLVGAALAGSPLNGDRP